MKVEEGKGRRNKPSRLRWDQCSKVHPPARVTMKAGLMLAFSMTHNCIVFCKRVSLIMERVVVVVVHSALFLACY